MPDICILKNEEGDWASALSESTGARIITSKEEAEGLYLTREGGALTLTDGRLSLAGDFSAMSGRLTPKNLECEAPVKAVKIKGRKSITVIDATAGLGEDSLLLAAAGFEVQLYEYDKIIFALLADAYRRGMEIPSLRPALSRMHLHCGDSISAMENREISAEVIFLDPMFPERQKSGLIKKKFQLLQRLESPCENGEALFRAAVSAGPEKIVVKRPQKGECLTQKKPSYVLNGSAVRYDCYLL